MTKTTAIPEVSFVKVRKCSKNWNVQFNSNNKTVKE